MAPTRGTRSRVHVSRAPTIQEGGEEVAEASGSRAPAEAETAAFVTARELLGSRGRGRLPRGGNATGTTHRGVRPNARGRSVNIAPTTRGQSGRARGRGASTRGTSTRQSGPTNHRLQPYPLHPITIHRRGFFSAPYRASDARGRPVPLQQALELEQSQIRVSSPIRIVAPGDVIRPSTRIARTRADGTIRVNPGVFAPPNSDSHTDFANLELALHSQARARSPITVREYDYLVVNAAGARANFKLEVFVNPLRFSNPRDVELARRAIPTHNDGFEALVTNISRQIFGYAPAWPGSDAIARLKQSLGGRMVAWGTSISEGQSGGTNTFYGKIAEVDYVTTTEENPEFTFWIRIESPWRIIRSTEDELANYGDTLEAYVDTADSLTLLSTQLARHAREQSRPMAFYPTTVTRV